MIIRKRSVAMTSRIRPSSTLILLCLALTPPAGAEEVTLEVLAGDAVRANTVVDAPLPPALRDHGHFTLTRVDNGQAVPVQAHQARLYWIVRDPLKLGAVRRYRLAPADEPKSSRVTVSDDKKRLLVQVDGKPVLAYNHAVVPSPDLKQPYYAKSGYIHPVYNPSGQVVSDDFNPDHAHQHGIMMAWRQMTFEGRSTNGWDQKAGLGRVEHVKVESTGDGPVFGHFTARLRHVDLTAPGGAKPALDESWYVQVYAFDDGFLFDVTSTQSCASDRPVSIDKMHYGGMAIRGHADWHKNRSYDFLTSEGKTKADGNQTRPHWVDLSGPVEGKPTGVLVLDHPGNFRFPQPVRLHPTMPYFCFTPAAEDSFAIIPGTPFISRYRFFVHDGKLDADLAGRLWRDYSRPPEVRVVAGEKRD
jgi:hypothetical protein